jgi:NAD(P)-dependent dehydrogenase (short-subunit alcohol dehydrogenase family)/acyl carrier protein
VWSDEGRVFAEISPTSTRQRELAGFDACVQVAALLGDTADHGSRSPFVPVSARHVHGHGAAVGPMTCVAMFEQQDANGVATSTRSVDVALYDADGRMVAAVEGLLLQRLDMSAERLEDCFYGVEWHPVEHVEGRDEIVDGRGVDSAVGTWLLFAGADAVGDSLARELRRTGARCVVVTSHGRPSDPDHVLVGGSTVDELVAVVRGLAGRDDVGIVFLLALDVASVDLNADEHGISQSSACGALVNLTRAMAVTGCRAPLRVVTRGVHRVSETDSAVAIAQAPLWGLGRAIREELPEMWGGLIDLDPTEGVAETARSLARELMAAPPHQIVETEVALRGSTRHVARIARQTVAVSDGAGIRPDATYLVTGAFGAIGSQVARWLVGRGARRLILLGRTELPARRTWDGHDVDSPIGRRVAVVRALEHLGAAVHVDAVDVGDAEAFGAYLDRFDEEGWPPVRGVFHAAAALGGGLIDESEPADFDELLRPKVIGAWVLSEHLADVDHFVMFSSIASLVPVAGQGAYAAGNAFLDALAHERAARGQRGLSINWGAWSDSTNVLSGESGQRRTDHGVGFKDAATRLWEAQGMRAMSAEHGLDALDRLLVSGHVQSVVASIDWAAFATTRLARPLAMTGDMVAEATNRQDAPDATRPGTATLAELFAVAPNAERLDLVEATVRRLVSRILKLPESRVDATQPFGTLGLDSLMAVELRNHLEAEVQLKLSATMAWNYPTVNELRDYLLARLDPSEALAGPPRDVSSTTNPAAVGEIFDAVAELSEDEALAALMEQAGS